MTDNLKTSFNKSRTMKIAICGKMCSGKSTLANTLKIMDNRYTIYSIGQAVKDIGADLFGMKEKDRNLLIQIGAKMREIDPDVWTKKTWSALTFQINDQHYFTYSFDWNGATLTAAKFTANAHADLDCDQKQSTFQRLGFGDPQANHAECAMYGSPAFFVDQETE